MDNGAHARQPECMRPFVLCVGILCLSCSSTRDRGAGTGDAGRAVVTFVSGAGGESSGGAGAAGLSSAGTSGTGAMSGGAEPRAGSAGDQMLPDAAARAATPAADDCEDRTLSTKDIGTNRYGVHSVLLELGMLRGVALHFLAGNGPTAFEHTLGTVEIIVLEAASVTERAMRTMTGCRRVLSVHAEVRVSSEDGRLNESIPTELALHSASEIKVALRVARDALVGTLRGDPALANAEDLVLEATYGATSARGTLRIDGTPGAMLAEWTGGRGDCFRPDQWYAAPGATDCGEIRSEADAAVRSCVSNAVTAGEPFSAWVVLAGTGVSRATFQSLPAELTTGGRAAFMQVRANETPPYARMRRCASVSTDEACPPDDLRSCLACASPGPWIPLCLQNGFRSDSREVDWEAL